MNKIIMKLDTLTCPSCMTKIEGALNQVAGVEKVKVLFNASKVKIDAAQTVTGADLQQIVEGLGYQVKEVKTKEMEG